MKTLLNHALLFSLLLQTGLSQNDPNEIVPINLDRIEVRTGLEPYTADGDQIIDFSHAGYRGGGVALPTVPVRVTLAPGNSMDDDSRRIQAAIDQVAALPLQADGYRGAVFLQPGMYMIDEELRVTTSGVVLSGSGSGKDGTVLFARRQGIPVDEEKMHDAGFIGLNFHPFVNEFVLSFRGGGDLLDETRRADIADAYVPVGATEVTVSNAATLAVGDAVKIVRVGNDNWTSLFLNGSGTRVHNLTATITAINGNTVQFDIPLSMSIKQEWGGGYIIPFTDETIRNVGVQDIRMVAEFNPEHTVFYSDRGNITVYVDEDKTRTGVHMHGVSDAWVQRITTVHLDKITSTERPVRRTTVQDCDYLKPVSRITGGRRYGYNLDGQQMLYQRNYSSETRHAYVSQEKFFSGPDVILDCLDQGLFGASEAHADSTTAFLFDNYAGGIWMGNREGGKIGGENAMNCVTWNNRKDEMHTLHAPLTTANFVFGFNGTIPNNEYPNGVYNLGTPELPRSLYLTQLERRLGPAAVQAITTPAQRAGIIDQVLLDRTSQSPFRANPAQMDMASGYPADWATIFQRRLANQSPVVLADAITRSTAFLSAPYADTIANTASDPDGESPTYHKIDGPDWLVVDPQGGLSGTPDIAGLGPNTFTILVKDTYGGVDSMELTIQIDLPANQQTSLLDPSAFPSLGTINDTTPSLTFDTDTATVSGGINAQGSIGQNADGSYVAVFAFDQIDLTTPPIITGSRPFVLAAHGDLRLATVLTATGGMGGESGDIYLPGAGGPGGAPGGEAHRQYTGGNAVNGNGPGGSIGNTTDIEEETPGGGGFGGAGGDGLLPGGPTYGDEQLTSLLGGSGAGGAQRAAGGGGGGAVGLLASGRLELTADALINVRGGEGAGHSGRSSAGGGSGGGVLLRGEDVILAGTIDARGGDGGYNRYTVNAGGGGGGRIAVIHRSSLSTNGASLLVEGGQPYVSDEATSPIATAGQLGTIFIGLDARIPISDWTDFNPAFSSDWLDFAALPPGNLSLGTIDAATPTLTFNTDTLAVSGGLSGSGLLGQNPDDSTVALFFFEAIDLAQSPTIIGSRPLVLISRNDLTIQSSLNVNGGNGAHTIHGTGIAGGGDGGDANRSETPGNPFHGQGPGGSIGHTTSGDISSSGGGGFGGPGGASTDPGGPTYGTPDLCSLIGGSGAGGTRNKGGGAGGGAIGLVANGTLTLSPTGSILAKGGSGGSSGAQKTSGGGSGGAILLRATDIIAQGLLDASGGAPGDATGSNTQGGGGGGGRIAILHHNTLDTTGATLTIAGGIAAAGQTGQTGQDGQDGTLYFGMGDLGVDQQWFIDQLGSAPTSIADWMLDHDGDGTSTLAEYILGGSPTAPDLALLHIAPPPPDDPAAAYALTFNLRNCGVRYTRYLLEETIDLSSANWMPVTPGNTETIRSPHETLAGFDRMVISNLPEPTATSGFYRLRFR